MAFNSANISFNTFNSFGPEGSAFWIYTTNSDNVAAITSTYFTSYPYLRQGDYIGVEASDKNALFAVTASNPNPSDYSNSVARIWT